MATPAGLSIARPAWDFARRLHLLVGLAAVTLGVGHMVAVWVERGGIKPFSTVGWLHEQLIIGASVVLAGAIVLVTSRQSATGLRPVAAGALVTVAFAQFLRYFAPFPALFSLLAPLDGLLVSYRLRPRALGVLSAAFFLLALVAAAAFLCVSYFGAGQ
jgi:hypothetical protein